VTALKNVADIDAFKWFP